MALKVEGTNLFYINDVGAVVEAGCLMELSVTGNTVDKTERTCIGSAVKEYVPGKRDSGTVSLTVRFDPAVVSHADFVDMWRDKTVAHWAIGLSDGTSVPTVDSDSAFDLPTDRTFVIFDGFFTDVPFDFPDGQEVQSKLQLQIAKGFDIVEATA